MKLAIAAFVVILAVNCGKQPDDSKPEETGRTRQHSIIAAPEPDATNIVTMAHGAVVIARTGELELDSSAMHAIDATATTGWITPPGDSRQTITIALPALTQISRVGLFAPRVPEGTKRADRVSFEVSRDGTAFQTLATFATPKKGSGTSAATPTEANYLRMTIVDTSAKAISIPTILAEGREVAPYKRPVIGGRWMLNNRQGSFSENGSEVKGTVEMQPAMKIEGGWRDRTIPYVFARGKEFGYGIMTPSADGRFVNCKWWFEEAIPLFGASPWFGERLSAAPEIAGHDVLDTWLQLRGFAPLYALSFDDQDRLSPGSDDMQEWLKERITKSGGKKLRIVTREFRRASPAANLRSSQAQLSVIRKLLDDRGVDLSLVTFAALGTTEHKETPGDLLEKNVFSRVELQLPQ